MNIESRLPVVGSLFFVQKLLISCLTYDILFEKEGEIVALKSNGDKEHVHLIITKEQKEVLQKEADRMSISLSAYIRLIIANWIQRRKKNGNDLRDL